MPKSGLWLMVVMLIISACQGGVEEQSEELEGDIYSSVFQDNYFHQLSYLNNDAEALVSLLKDQVGDNADYLIFWYRDGDCDSCIEQQMQFVKLVLEKSSKPVVVFADYSNKRVFSSVQSSFSFVDMKMVQIPMRLSESLGSPFYVDFQKTNNAISIYKPIPERASWTNRYLESIGAL